MFLSSVPQGLFSSRSLSRFSILFGRGKTDYEKDSLGVAREKGEERTFLIVARAAAAQRQFPGLKLQPRHGVGPVVQAAGPRQLARRRGKMECRERRRIGEFDH